MSRLAGLVPWGLRRRWALHRMRRWTVRPDGRRLTDEEQGLLEMARFAWMDEGATKRLAWAERAAEQEAAAAAGGDDWWRG